MGTGDPWVDPCHALSPRSLKQYETEELWREELAGHRATQGDTHIDTLIAMGFVTRSCFERKRYEEAEELWR
jgi:hypothetical protein